MIIESEMKALQLAKKVFEHFTHDSLPIAREIIAMEQDMGQHPDPAIIYNGSDQPILEEKKKDSEVGSSPVNGFPVTDLNAVDLVIPNNPATELHLREERIKSEIDDLPF